MALRSLADGALFAEVYGEGPPQVLALHGWGRRGRDFSASLEGIPALALDLPGFGASPSPGTVIGAEGYAEMVARTLDSFAEPPVLVGHSFGGRVAVCLAAMHPETTGALVLTGVPLTRLSPVSKPPLGYRVLRALHRAGLISEDRIEARRHKIGSADYRAASGVMRGILVRVVGETYESQLRRIRSPVHLLWGESDREVPLAVARRAADVLEQAGVSAVTLEVLPGVGHDVPREAPQALRSAIQSVTG